jgi:hypothetical protein
MIDCGSLELAQARLQSRHGQCTTEPVWQRLETVREFSALLDLARHTALRPWLVGITAPGDAAQIETVLRTHWRRTVDELIGWMPPAWLAALDWCAVLTALPTLQHLARGGQPWPWMNDDPALRPLCAAPATERRATLAAGPMQALASGWDAPEALADSWLAEWQRRLPTQSGEWDDSLRQVAAALRTHAADFAAAPPGAGGMLRRSLHARLTLLLRRNALEPAAAFTHLALCALDLERLRGELLRRALFGGAMSVASMACRVA